MKPLFWFKVMKGTVCAVIVTFAMLCLFTLVGLKADDPALHVSLYANVSLFIGVFLGGIVSSRGADAPFLNALVCGVTCAILLFLPSLILSEWDADSLLRMALTVVSSVLGAVLTRGREGSSVRRQSAKRRREIAKKYGG